MQRFLTTLQFFRSAGYVASMMDHGIITNSHTCLNEGGISLILLTPQELRVGSGCKVVVSGWALNISLRDMSAASGLGFPRDFARSAKHAGGRRWNRTTDTGIFNPMLYRVEQ